MSGAIVAIARVIQRPIAFAMVWVSAVTLAFAERGLLWPRAGLALLALGDSCARLARRML